MIRKIGLGALVGCLSACQSLSGDVRSYSIDYGTAMAQFQDEQLITNILRSGNNDPIHFSELGQVNGSLQEQIQLGATIPLGKYVGASKSADPVNPQVTFASSPTFTTSPLDTQAFTVGLMQPIDATYLVSRLTDADPLTKELLLLLFIESIDNADANQVPSDFKGPAHIRNTLGNEAFRSYVQTLLGKAEFRLITVLTPIGPSFTFDPSGKNSYKLTDVLSNIDEVNVHLKEVGSKEYRLFHMWSEQLALCYGQETAVQATSPKAPAAAIGPRFDLFMDVLTSKGSGKKTGSGGGGNAPSNGGSSTKGGGGGGASPPTVATPIMPLVGFVQRSDCFSPNYVDAKTDDEPHVREFQISLRSVRSAMSYLGAIARAGGELRSLDGQTVLFSLPKETAGDPGREHDLLKVSYRKETYAIRDAHTAKAVQILSELVDALKLSSDIATTKQVQVVP